MQQILWGVVKEMLKGKFVALNDYVRQKILKNQCKQSGISKHARDGSSEFSSTKTLKNQ